MNKAEYGYVAWKKWNRNNFGKINLGGRFYFDQFFNKYKLLSNQKVILEVGFGNGELLGYLKSLNHVLIGVETNSVLTSLAIENGYDAFVGLAWKLKALENKKFDLILAFDVIEHMGLVDLESFFSWAAIHLSDKGKLVLRFPEGASPFGLAYQHGDFTHISTLTKNKLNSLCNGKGMNLLSYDDEYLRSDKLCSFGLFGKITLLLLQGYAKFFKSNIKVFLYPLSIDLKLSTNSIAIIEKMKS